jgi:hypothetical protein
VSDASSIYQRARRDVASMLGYDLDNLSAEHATRLDVATALRVLLDNQSARLVRGESLDARELLMASEALSRILPPLREPPAASNAPDPRQIMWETYIGMRRRGEFANPASTFEGRGRRIAELEAKIAELEATALGGSTAAITPPTCDIVPPGERAECDPGMRPGPDDPRPPVVIEAKAVRTPPPPAPQPQAAPTYDYNTNSEWKDYVNSDGSIRSTPRGVGSFSGKDWGPVG